MKMDRTAAFYSGPSYQFRGAGFPVYAGSRRQRGGSILGALKQMVLPALSNLGKTVGKAALSQAVGLASDVAMDAARGRNIGQSLKQHGLKRLKNVGLAGVQGLRQSVFPSRKRSAPRKKRQPPKKKRRIGVF